MDFWKEFMKGGIKRIKHILCGLFPMSVWNSTWNLKITLMFREVYSNPDFMWDMLFKISPLTLRSGRNLILPPTRTYEFGLSSSCYRGCSFPHLLDPVLVGIARLLCSYYTTTGVAAHTVRAHRTPVATFSRLVLRSGLVENESKTNT